jgi:hypothetical protein
MPSPKIAARGFAERLDIPTDKEQQTGRRREEIDAEAAGNVGFNRDPIIPATDAGTKENPILVSVKNNRLNTNLFFEFSFLLMLLKISTICDR